MAVVTFAQFIGGDTQTQLDINSVPAARKIKKFNFGTDVTGWTFVADYQTIVVDTITTDRLTGDPNFASSKIIGSFPLVTIAGADEPSIINAVSGEVDVYFPENMYSGPIIPDKQQNVPIVVFGFTWTTATTPAESANVRWGIIQNWEPEVAVGDPVTDGAYIPLTL
jgi:hypothetical protein